VSARPSDAVALAVRIQVPVFVADQVLDEAGVVVPEDEEAVDESDGEEIADDEVERFREFLDSVSPEDFGGEKG
jgi:bifunctional DNase/RNase